MDYIKKTFAMLENWVHSAQSECYTCPDRPELLCYGAGYNGWGMQTHQKAFAAFAILATSSDTNIHCPKLSTKTLLDDSRRMLRYMLETHIEGDYTCLEGEKWGHTWISALGTERTMHAIEALMPYLDDKEKSLLKKVLLSEADWLLDYYAICAAPDARTGKNRPESNIWNGCFLHRVAAMYPAHTRSAAYRQKGNAFLVNGISIPADRNSARVYDGIPISQLHQGNNFYETYALDHHEYLNIGYMVICLSNLAMFYFSCKKQNYCIPEALYHHAKSLWQLIKTCIGDDGRLLRVGGDSRVRYCYCQDYLLPTLLFVQDRFGDADAEKLKALLVDLFYKEFQSNGDGSFLSDRCRGFKEISPIYYTRLESDKACVLSMLACWNSLGQKGGKQIPALTHWQAPSHGACIENSKNRFASWAFYGAEGMTGLCLPARIGNFAEWQNNLAAEILGCGTLNETCIRAHREITFSGGFLAYGEADRLSQNFLAEQQKDEITAKQQIAFAALPDDATTVVLQYAYAPNRIYLKSLQGIHLNIPNDIYNNFQRDYHFAGGGFTAGKFNQEKIIKTDSRWLNIDQQLGVIAGYSGEKLHIYRPGKRQIGIKKHTQKDNLYQPYTQNLSCDVIDTKIDLQPHWADKSSVLIDTAAILIAGICAEDTRKKAEEMDSLRIETSDFVRWVCVKGQDGKLYAVLLNLSDQTQTAVCTPQKNLRPLTDVSVAGNHLVLPPKAAAVLCMA